MKLKRLFQALVLGGAALGVAHCGGGTSPTPAGNTQQLLPDGGIPDGGHGPSGGGPAGW